MSETSHTSRRARGFKTQLGTAIEVTTDLFLSRALPPIRHQLNPATINAKLTGLTRKAFHHRPVTLRNRWRGFPQDPAQLVCSVENTFRHFPDAVAAIIKAGCTTSGKRPHPIIFQNNPDCEMEYVNRQEPATAFPDAYLFKDGIPSWNNFVVSGEHKKLDDEAAVIDNSYKVVHSMSSCMNRDPRRRFTFGYTIENATMRLWYYDRSQIVVSEPFNFITQDREPMIYFFLSLIYAEPQELGWDLTMNALDDGVHYDIRVDGFDHSSRIYRTLEPIYGLDSEVLRHGRTRVWKAILLADGKETGEPVILKDAWVHADCMPEGFVLEDIRKIDCDPEVQDYVNTSFPSPLFHGDVFVDPNRMDLDCTRSFSPNAEASSEPKRISRMRSGHDTDLGRQDSTGDLAELGKRRLVHYRIVLKEAGKPINQEQSLVTIFRILAQIAWGAYIVVIFRSGWIHHDISLGNILLVKDRAMLVDMEYATKISQGTDHRIGTPGFMAVEVDRQEYLFLPTKTTAYVPPSPISAEDLRALVMGEKSPSLDSDPSVPEDTADAPANNAPFRYNALHDLESLWWIAVYFVFKKQILDVSKGDTEAQVIPVSEDHRAAAERLFYDRPQRCFVMTVGTFFEQYIYKIPPVLQPHARVLQNLKLMLAAAYEKAEKNLSSITLDTEIHDEFMRSLASLGSEKWSHLRIRPFPALDRYGNPVEVGSHVKSSSPIAALPGTKRPASELAEDEGQPPPKITKKARTRIARPRIGVRTRPYLPRKTKEQRRPSD
ncbi:hypothetical protein EIP86_001400 [Pleurotus ostreatoroseus]|nr:hypothetical protein EIP86_001400 [Pleurotus ostreatoroseus]